MRACTDCGAELSKSNHAPDICFWDKYCHICWISHDMWHIDQDLTCSKCGAELVQDGYDSCSLQCMRCN